MRTPPSIASLVSLALVVAGAAGCSADELLAGEQASTVPASQVARPVIRSVATSDGFTQVRQNAVVEIVIRGKRLATATRVTVGPAEATIASASQHEVRATLFTSSRQPLGLLDVTVVTARGDATAPAALTLTPFVVSPVATAGHGTFESPIPLCDPQLELTSQGSTVLLLAGTHRCGRTVNIAAGATVQGAGSDATIVQGSDGGPFMFSACCHDGGLPSLRTTFRDLAFHQPLAASITAFSDLVVERVVDHGGIEAPFHAARIDDYRYEGPAFRAALDLGSAQLTGVAIRGCGAGDGVRVGVEFAPFGGASTLADVVVEDCERGLVIGGPFPRRVNMNVDLRDSRLHDNRIGLWIEDGFTTMTDTVITGDDATPRRSVAGVRMTHGALAITGAAIAGQEDVGIFASNRNETGSPTFAAQLFASELAITGARVGIDFDGLDCLLAVDRATLRDQTEAALRVRATDSPIEIQDSELSVLSGFAIDDLRFSTAGSYRYVRAFGTTLNGVSFAGSTIEGPATLAPFYRMTGSDSGLEF